MKKHTLLILLLFAFCLNAKSDIILVNSDDLRPPISISIQNMDKYPGVAIVGVLGGVALSKANSYFTVTPGHYYTILVFETVKFYAVSKAYLDKIGIENIEWETNEHVHKSNLVIDKSLYQEKFPIVSIKIEYNIAGFKAKELVLYKSKQKFSYKGKPELVLPFEFNGDQSKLRQNIE